VGRVFKQTTSHGFPPRIRLPRRKAPVRILMKDGVPCNEVVEIVIPAKTIGMRDPWRWNGGTCEGRG
jgi:hypothetical protein